MPKNFFLQQLQTLIVTTLDKYKLLGNKDYSCKNIHQLLVTVKRYAPTIQEILLDVNKNDGLSVCSKS